MKKLLLGMIGGLLLIIAGCSETPPETEINNLMRLAKKRNLSNVNKLLVKNNLKGRTDGIYIATVYNKYQRSTNEATIFLYEYRVRYAIYKNKSSVIPVSKIFEEGVITAEKKGDRWDYSFQ